MFRSQMIIWASDLYIYIVIWTSGPYVIAIWTSGLINRKRMVNISNSAKATPVQIRIIPF